MTPGRFRRGSGHVPPDCRNSGLPRVPADVDVFVLEIVRQGPLSKNRIPGNPPPELIPVECKTEIILREHRRRSIAARLRAERLKVPFSASAPGRSHHPGSRIKSSTSAPEACPDRIHHPARRQARRLGNRINVLKTVVSRRRGHPPVRPRSGQNQVEPLPSPGTDVREIRPPWAGRRFHVEGAGGSSGAACNGKNIRQLSTGPLSPRHLSAGSTFIRFRTFTFYDHANPPGWTSGHDKRIDGRHCRKVNGNPGRNRSEIPVVLESTKSSSTKTLRVRAC